MNLLPSEIYGIILNYMNHPIHALLICRRWYDSFYMTIYCKLYYIKLKLINSKKIITDIYSNVTKLIIVDKLITDDYLKKFINLTYLDCKDCNLITNNGISTIFKLKHLHTNNSKITDIFKYNNLIDLSYHTNKFTCIFPKLKKMTYDYYNKKNHKLLVTYINKNGIYFVHNNRSRPFKVDITSNKISIYKLSYKYKNKMEQYEYENYIIHYKINILNIYSYAKVYIGDDQSTPYNSIGNAILIVLNDTECIVVSSNIMKIKYDGKIIMFFAITGNNDVIYSYLITQKKIYMLIDDYNRYIYTIDYMCTAYNDPYDIIYNDINYYCRTGIYEYDIIHDRIN